MVRFVGILTVYFTAPKKLDRINEAQQKEFAEMRTLFCFRMPLNYPLGNQIIHIADHYGLTRFPASSTTFSPSSFMNAPN